MRLLGGTFALLAFLAVGPVAAVLSQAKAPAAPSRGSNTWTPPRTPWGDPDLQGVYANDNEYATPLERPDEFAGRTLADVTPEEMAAIRQSAQQRMIAANARIGEATRRRILRLAARREYRRDGLARGLALRRSHTLGLIIPNIRNPIYAEMARGIEDVARRQGFTAFFLSTDDDGGTARHAIAIPSPVAGSGLVV